MLIFYASKAIELQGSYWNVAYAYVLVRLLESPQNGEHIYRVLGPLLYPLIVLPILKLQLPVTSERLLVEKKMACQ